jgi:hypothetical protein
MWRVAPSVRARLYCIVDYYHLDGAVAGSQAQPKLFLNCLKYRWRVRVCGGHPVRRRKSYDLWHGILTISWRPIQREGEQPGHVCLVQNRPG